ncbi:MAG: hypothetical protein ACTHL7_07600 [Steroidobacteraceae bacterium]|jgi:hypothetical protein
MEILLIDMGALAIFLGYMAIVYWHAVSHDSRPRDRARIDLMRKAPWSGAGLRQAWLSWVAKEHERGRLARQSGSTNARRN